MIGWTYVAAQAVLLLALIFLPARDDWSTPSWLRTFGYLFVLAGLVIIAIASLRLGRSLTPTPVPTASGKLTTAGLYRFVRHPIYTGVLAVVLGLVVRSGSWIHFVIGVGTALFFNNKAKWEEQQLAERYPDYADYAAATPRFVPFAPPRKTG